MSKYKDEDKDYTIEELFSLRGGALNPEVLTKLEEGFKNDFTIEEASRYAGIHPDTYNNYQNMSSEFREKMARARDFLFTRAKKVLVKEIIENESASYALEVLKRRQRHLYSERSEYTGPDGTDLIPAREVSNEELEKLEQRIKDSLSKKVEE